MWLKAIDEDVGEIRNQNFECWTTESRQKDRERNEDLVVERVEETRECGGDIVIERRGAPIRGLTLHNIVEKTC